MWGSSNGAAGAPKGLAIATGFPLEAPVNGEDVVLSIQQTESILQQEPLLLLLLRVGRVCTQRAQGLAPSPIGPGGSNSRRRSDEDLRDFLLDARHIRKEGQRPHVRNIPLLGPLAFRC